MGILLSRSHGVRPSAAHFLPEALNGIYRKDGTQPSPGLSEERRNDIREVLNYRAAMRMAEKMLADVPLSQRVIREAHKVLLDGVRGQGKAPGESGPSHSNDMHFLKIFRKVVHVQ